MFVNGPDQNGLFASSTSISDLSTEADRRPTTPDVPAAHELTSAARVSAANLAASGALDTLFEHIDSGQVQLSRAAACCRN